MIFKIIYRTILTSSSSLLWRLGGALFFLFFCTSLFATISVTALKTEGMTNPLGIDVEKPRFGWKLEATTEQNVLQKAYQILVSTSAENLANDNGDIWNSGKVSTESSIWIPFMGKALESNSAYFWKVKVWTNKGETEWSNVANWSMGLLSENDWKAQWIGLDKAMPWDNENFNSRLSARYMRKEFSTRPQFIFQVWDFMNYS